MFKKPLFPFIFALGIFSAVSIYIAGYAAGKHENVFAAPQTLASKQIQNNAAKNEIIQGENKIIRERETKNTNPLEQKWFFLKDGVYALTVVGPFRNLPDCQEIKDWSDSPVIKPERYYRSSKCWQGPNLPLPISSGSKP